MKKIKQFAWCWPYLIGYIIFAIFYRVSPIFFDMWVEKTDYIVRGSSFIGVLKAVFFTGGCWKNARYLANIFNIYIVSYEWLSDFLMPFVFLIPIFLIQKIIGKNQKWYIALAGIGMFHCVSNGIVAQTYTYSYVLFLLPITFFVCFIYIIEQYIENELYLNSICKKIFFLVLVYLNACFLENVSCAFTLIMAWYFYRERFVNKRKNKLLLCGLCISLAQTLYMNLYLIIKQTRPLAESTANLFEIVFRNFRILIIETWLSNGILFGLFLMLLIVALINSKTITDIKKKILVISDAILLVSYAIWLVLIYANGGIDTAAYKIEFDVKVSFVPQTAEIFFALMFICINFYILYQVAILDSRIGIMFFAGGCSLIPVLLTPNTGWRISSFYIFMLICVMIALMSCLQVDESRGMKSVLLFAGTVVFFVGSLIWTQRVNRIYNVNSEYIDKIAEVKELQQNEEWDFENDVLILPYFEARDIMGEGRPDSNSYYMWNFCMANGLDKRTKVSTGLE